MTLTELVHEQLFSNFQLVKQFAASTPGHQLLLCNQ